MHSLTAAQISIGIADAESKRIADADLPAILAAHRAGDPQAAVLLNAGLLWLAWDRFERHRGSRTATRADVLSQATADLGAIIERLRVETPDNPIGYIRHALRYSAAHHQATMATPMTQVPEVPAPATDSLLEDPIVRHPLITPSGRAYVPPSRFKQEMPSDAIEQQEQDEIDANEREAEYQRLWPHAQSDFERRILTLRRSGSTIDDIADAMRSTAFSKIENALARLWRRAA